ncbi:hypothetical protein MKX08_006904 [Trichoderma sp. CBMAI-0020]|nr:hypothetical protein MKX08_006904 [Trichoderma sp. CBMAI-0020]
MSKEPEFDGKLELVLGPSSPKTTGDGHSQVWLQRSFNHNEEISEKSLADGFTFPRREPPRPGQFSDIPRRVPPATFATTLPAESLEKKFTSPPKENFTIPLPRASPLDLSEFCLPSKPTDMSSDIPEIPEQPVLVRCSIEESGMVSGYFKKPMFPTHSVHPDIKESAGPRSASPESVKETKAIGRNEQRHSPPSTCGDPEIPTHRPHSHHHKISLIQPTPCASAKGRKQQPRHRSSSVASSNISKKRAARTLEAMIYISECLNQCLEMNNDEYTAARSEAKKLRSDIQRQKEELKKSHILLDEKDSKFSEAEELYNALVEENTVTLGDNKSLYSELECLRQQLLEEKKRSELLKEKHQESRSRLNDAIKEQQDLFSRSRDLCKETMVQLRQEKAAKTSASDAVDKALEASQKKRAEMKKCLEEYRLQADKDIQQKNQVIATLKEKLDHQERLLAETQLADTLRAQTEEMGVARECVRALEAKVEALMAHHTTQNEQRQLDAQQSTDILINGGNFVVGNMLSRDDLAVELGAVEKNIMESFSPVMISLESGQRDSSNVITHLESSVRRNLDQFRNEAFQLAGRWEENKQDNGVQIQDLFKQVQELGSGLKKTENVCEHIGLKFDALVDNKQSQQHTTDTHLQGLTQRFLDRETKLDDMESQLQQMHQGLTTKIDTMMSGALETDKEATKLIRSTATELRGVLERGFGQEREKISQLFVESGNIAKALAAHVDTQKESATQNNHKKDELQATLEMERGAVAQLTRKLQEFEHQAEENEVLRDRWIKEIQSVEAVRAQLKTIQEQTSPAKDCEKKMDRLVEISEFIRSSTSYLATESEWIQQELVARAPEPTVEVDNDSSATSTGSSKGAGNQPAVKDDGVFRKVTVCSPDPGESSPSPPPTVVQEQKRRRETTQLRSILKGQIQSSTLQVDQNKPLNLSNDSLGKAGSSSKQMVAEICSRMVRHDWSFPTVADFERDVHLASKKRESPQDNTITSQLDNPSYRDSKKSRMMSYIAE